MDPECYRLAHDFVCQLLQPACLSERLVLPCRDFCHDFYKQCNARLPDKFADRLICDNFPARGEQQCLSRPGGYRTHCTSVLNSTISGCRTHYTLLSLLFSDL